MAWPRLRPPHSPKPRWIKCRWVQTTLSFFKLFTVTSRFSLQPCSNPHETFSSGCFEQISSSSSTAAPVNTGVKIPTCKFTLKDKFLTSPADLYRVFLNQEVGFSSLTLMMKPFAFKVNFSSFTSSRSCPDLLENCYSTTDH